MGYSLSSSSHFGRKNSDGAANFMTDPIAILQKNLHAILIFGDSMYLIFETFNVCKLMPGISVHLVSSQLLSMARSAVAAGAAAWL